MKKKVSTRRIVFIYKLHETLKHKGHCSETKVIETKVNPDTQTHTHTHSLSLSLSHTHTHTPLAQDPAWLWCIWSSNCSDSGPTWNTPPSVEAVSGAFSIDGKPLSRVHDKVAHMASHVAGDLLHRGPKSRGRMWWEPQDNWPSCSWTHLRSSV